ncbi:unnamed protein product [Trifolium pratense]|uniref:Uncharacterized protein n=1 Tax=Trifolium pratense TaxID=57577 RepID=A0ACB0K9X5_TRIPR|nr:unnamed protein product [Trifolium pratense]
MANANAPNSKDETSTSVPVEDEQIPSWLQYYDTLLSRGKLNSFESMNLSRLVLNRNKQTLLRKWLAEYKLECTEELGDFLKVLF